VLYENLGNGRFRDVTAASGIGSVKPGFGLVAAIFDADGDGRPDIYVGNDSTPSFLLRNRTAAPGFAPAAGSAPATGSDPPVRMRFEEIGAPLGLCCNGDGGAQAVMGITLADVNGDGRADPFTTAFSSDPKTLHVAVPAPGGISYEDRGAQYGLGMVTRAFLSWGAGFFDFDLDGDEDLLVSNGHVYPEAEGGGLDAPYRQPVLLFERDGARFGRSRTAGEAIEKPVAGRAIAFGDLDGDGDVDAVQTTLNGPVRILRNDSVSTPGARRPLVIALRQPGKNPRALGARVELIQEQGTPGAPRSQVRWIGGGSFQSTDAPEACVTLDPKGGPARVRVTWPGSDAVSETPVAPPGRGVKVVVKRP
jgi:hypothetical protein